MSISKRGKPDSDVVHFGDTSHWKLGLERTYRIPCTGSFHVYHSEDLDDVTCEKCKGYAAAKHAIESTGIDTKFIEFDGERYHFSITRYKSYRVIDSDGNEISPAGVHDDKFRPSSLPVYSQTSCYPVQLTNGDIEFMIRKGLTQEPHERFNDA